MDCDYQQAKTMHAAIRCDDAAMRPCSTNLNVKSKQSSGIDRISNLADELLIHILSFLPTNEAIVTSILSRRWRHIYTWIPNLEFDTLPIDNYLIIYPQILACFVNHVKNVLRTNQCKNLIKFHLQIRLRCTRTSYYPDLKPTLLRKWILYSLRRRVKELDLSIKTIENVKLPKKVFSCETLEVLNLDGNFDVKLPNKFCLPNLKVCHLKSINFPQGGFLRGLLSGCPSIEDLTMRHCSGGRDLETIHISSTSLKILVIGISRSNSDKKLVLETPNLQHLEYADAQLAQDYSIGSLNLLVKASINIRGFGNGGLESMLKLLRPLSNVRNLTVEGSWLRVPNDADYELPVFRNLEHLNLTLPDRKNWRKGLLELLSCSPSLETLYVPGAWPFRRGHEESSWVASEEIPSCLRFHLKKIVIGKDRGLLEKFEMVEYFLRNASVLQVLEVAFNHETLSENALKKLPRASMNCSIIVHHSSSPAITCAKFASFTPCDGAAAMKPCLINSIPKSMHPSGIDRISNLSDELLIHILNFLPTNEAIVTSILSRRWRHIYTWIPNLEFDTSPINDCLHYPQILACFVTHVKNVLRANQCQALTKFHLKIGLPRERSPYNSDSSSNCSYPGLKPTLLTKWISYSLLRRVKELDLSINVNEKVKLPKKVFTSKTLEVLKLDVNLDVKLPKKFCLSKLKVCHLKSMYFPTGDFLRCLLSGCPSIEDLSMRYCSGGRDLQTIHISSPSLRILVVNYIHPVIRVSRQDSWGGCSFKYYKRSNVVLETPNLQQFKYVDRLVQDYSIGNLNALVKASLDITEGLEGGFSRILVVNIYPIRRDGCYCIRYTRSNVVLETPNLQRFKYVDDFIVQDYSIGNLNALVKASLYITYGLTGGCQSILNLLRPLSNVRYLTLQGSWLMEWEDVERECQLPVFRKLEHLKLGLPDNTNWRKGLLELLSCSPSLTTLTVTGARHPIQYGADYYRVAAKEIPSCLRFNLEKIVIRADGELDMVKYFLRNASVLQKLEVAFNSERLTETALKKLPRASLNCTIKVLKDDPED